MYDVRTCVYHYNNKNLKKIPHDILTFLLYFLSLLFLLLIHNMNVIISFYAILLHRRDNRIFPYRILSKKLLFVIYIKTFLIIITKDRCMYGSVFEKEYLYLCF